MITKPSSGRIIVVTSCNSCPHHSVEESNKHEYIYCWAIMETLKDLTIVHENCPLEEVDFEWENE